MGGYSDRRLPVVLVLAFFALLAFGCIGLPSETAPAGDDFGPKAEALNARIAAAASESAANSIATELAALEATAQSEGRYSGYLPLLEAQNKTLKVLLVYFEFQSEGAKLGTSGPDCSRDYSKFISDLRLANATAASAVSKANAYKSSNPDSTANLLVSAIGKASPPSMAAYADILEMELLRNCLESMAPEKAYDLPLSGTDALDIAASLAGSEYFVYGFESALPSGTIITAPRAMGDENFTLQSGTWFFFLDSAPWAPFGHDTRFVMIDGATGNFTVSNETMYPIIDGRDYWKSVDERLDAANVLYPEDAADYLGLPANLSGESAYYVRFYPMAGTETAVSVGEQPVCCRESKKYALIMTGSNDSMFQADTERMYNHLKSSGFADADITYLAAKDGVAGSDGITSVAALAAALGNLSEKAKCCDEVFIYLAGHGAQDRVWKYRHKATNETRWIRRLTDLGGTPGDWEYTNTYGYFHNIDVLGGEANSQALASFIKSMNSCKITVMYQSCFSGAAAPTLAAPGVAILAPVDSEHSSYGANRAAGVWGAGSFFSQAYISAKGRANATADTNHDGTVSEKEAFDYADRKNHDEMESERAYWQGLADGEANATRKARYQAKADGIQEQIGVYKDGGPCWCCYIGCNETTRWLCILAEGRNVQNSTACAGKKIGDYCGPVTTPPPVTEPPPATGNLTGGNDTEGTGGTTAGGTGEETPPGDNATAVCGDGLIGGAEQCDHGNYSTNKCAEGAYCNKRQCKKLETSVVCGDGKISSPAEDCDGGSVDYKICQPGYTCSICKCVPEKAECGDGRVTAPEECDHGNTYTKDCPGGKTCYSCRCLNPDDVPEEAYCGNNKREGTEACDGTDSGVCSSDEDCESCRCIPRPTEPVCGNGKKEAGEACESDSDCSTNYRCSNCACIPKDTAPTPYCGDGAVNGNEECDPTASPSGCYEPSVCGNTCKCVSPPALNCENICAQTSGAQVIGSGYSTQSQCQAAASSFFTSRTCYTTCKYSWFYRVDNVAGFASCCCGVKKEFPCDDCPGENPYCQPSESVCPANAPGWYQP